MKGPFHYGFLKGFLGRDDDQRSLTVVRGLRFAWALVTKRPDFALRADPVDPPPVFSNTVVDGLRLPCAFVT